MSEGLIHAVRRAVREWLVLWYWRTFVIPERCPCSWPIKSKRLIHWCGRMDPRDRPELGPPWREGLDDSDTVGTDIAKFWPTDEGARTSVNDLLAESDVQEQLIGSGVRADSREGHVRLQDSALIDLHFALAAKRRLSPRDGLNLVADGNDDWKTELVLIHVA